MGQRRANDAVASLLRLSYACKNSSSSFSSLSSPSSSQSLAQCAHSRSRSRCISTTTLPARPIRPIRSYHGRCASTSALSQSTRDDGPRIAIIGGGLTGLTAAYYLARDLPSNARLTLFEGSDRLGGWIKTDRVPVDVGGVKGTVSFERGPRTLSSLSTSAWRFDDLVLYDLALNLGLKVVMPSDRPRYIYYPDHLVPLPPAASLSRFIREPLFLESIGAGFGFILRRLIPRTRTRSAPEEDMSISEWIHSITGSHSMSNNIVSAVVHGIYGGDIDKLSARSVLDAFYWKYYMPSLQDNVKRLPVGEEDLMTQVGQDAEIRKLALKPKGSLLHFGDAGMESLPVALADVLKGQPNVHIKLREPVQNISYKQGGDNVEITSFKDETTQTDVFDKVVATVSAQTLAGMTNHQLDVLNEIQSVSIMTVNLWYPQRNLKPPGFGYLIPRSTPVEQNPERALGVFFDSDVSAVGPGEPQGTKLFVLMGGHYYEGADAPPVPSQDEAIEQAKSLLERHLGIPRDTPCFAMASFAKDCIPQHHVGHQDLLLDAKEEISETYGGRLAVAGGSYHRIGAMSAMRSGYDIAQNILAEADMGSYNVTGLEYLDKLGETVDVPVSMIPVRRFAAKRA